MAGLRREGQARQIVGCLYRPNRPDLDSLKQEIAKQTSNRLTFEEIHEVAGHEGRVVMFQIPPALRGMPTAWKGHWYGRDNESLGPSSLHEIEQIRQQVTRKTGRPGSARVRRWPTWTRRPSPSPASSTRGSTPTWPPRWTGGTTRRS